MATGSDPSLVQRFLSCVFSFIHAILGWPAYEDKPRDTKPNSDSSDTASSATLIPSDRWIFPLSNFLVFLGIKTNRDPQAGPKQLGLFWSLWLFLFNRLSLPPSESKKSLSGPPIAFSLSESICIEPISGNNTLICVSSCSSGYFYIASSLISLEVIDPTNAGVQQPTTTTEDIIDQNFLDSALESKEKFNLLMKLEGETAIIAINLIHKDLVTSKLSKDKRLKYFAILSILCSNCEVLPEALMIPEGVEINDGLPKAGGALTDLRQGIYQGKIVAVKVLRLHAVEDPALLKKSFYKVAAIWSYLHHPNVLPFIGVATKPFQFSLVSPWMENGNISEYLKENPQSNRVPLLKDMVDGLEYLHSENIVHGNLKARNILIKDNRQACLAGFELATVISATTSGYQTSAFSGGTLRWMAPELLSPEEFGFQQCVPSKESDVYAFGMVVYEVITGYIPFALEVVRDKEVILKVIRGDRPRRPTNLATTNLLESVWPITERCWCPVARERLTLPQVSEILEVEISKLKQEERHLFEINAQYVCDNDSDLEMITDRLYAL